MSAQELAGDWLRAMKEAGIEIVASLAESWLVDVLDAVDADPDITHVQVAREPEIVGICAGAWLGGRRAAGLMGTAGLLACGHELTTLNLAHEIPLFVIGAHRGQLDDPLTYQVGQGLVGDEYLRALGIPTVEVRTRSDIALLPAAYERSLLVKRPLVFYAEREALRGGAK